MVTPRNKRPPIRTTRERIIDSAARLFNSRGYHQTSIIDIAQEAGVAKGSVYYHFPSKDQLLVSVIEEGVRLIQETIDARTAGVDDPAERLLHTLGAIYDVLMDYQGLAHFALLGGCEGIGREAKEKIDAARERFETDLEARVRELVGDMQDASILASILFGALEGAVRAAGAGRKVRRRRSRERVREALLEFCRQALASRVSR